MSCGLSNLDQMYRSGMCDRLNDGDSLSDPCLYVTLGVAPPEELKFPRKYNGLRVFYKVGGEAIPLKPKRLNQKHLK